jgi:outer membrane assembly lipoprotein YfgL
MRRLGLRHPMLPSALAALVAVCAALLVAACAGPEKPQPAPLAANPASLPLRLVWSQPKGLGDEPLDIKADGENALLATKGGLIVSLSAANGAENWRLNLGAGLTSGLGGDASRIAVVSQGNFLVSIEQGKEAWRTKLQALVLTAPLVAGGRVFVLSGDRSISAFDGASGRRLWQQQRTGEPLILGQAGLLMAVGDTLVVGLGGRLVGLNPQNGSTRWDVAVANVRGTNEVERLADIVAGSSRLGSVVCVRAFQSAVGCVDAANGRLLWTRTANGYTGLGGDDSVVAGTEADGRLRAWQRGSGEVLWTSENFRFRGLGAPAVWAGKLVFGDSAGLVHLVGLRDGALVNRLSTDDSGVALRPLVLGSTVVVATQRGGLYAYAAQ